MAAKIVLNYDRVKEIYHLPKSLESIVGSPYGHLVHCFATGELLLYFGLFSIFCFCVRLYFLTFLHIALWKVYGIRYTVCCNIIQCMVARRIICSPLRHAILFTNYYFFNSLTCTCISAESNNDF